MTTGTWRAGGRSNDRWTVLPFQALALGLGLTLCVVAAETGSRMIGAAALMVALAYVAPYLFRSWRALIALLIIVVLFIPIKRYQFPVHLPFDLEPYRVVVGCLVLIWCGALLVDPKLRLRKSGLETPILFWFLVILSSICVNFQWIEQSGITVEVVKTLSFFASFFLTYFLIVSATRTRGDLNFMIRVLVGGGAIVAFFAIIEYRTGYNVFNHLGQVFPVLRYTNDLALSEITRSDRLRVYGPAQHPIALAAALVMLTPLAVYVALTSRKLRWWIAAGLLAAGALATLSRTGVLMFIVVAIIFSILRWTDTKRLAPVLVPALIAVFLALPQALGSLESAFFPKGGLVADQQSVGSVAAGSTARSGRLVTLGPGLRQFERRPFFGQGFGTRIIDRENPQLTNSNILDDQWLGSLIETGALGIGAMIWLVVRSIRRLGRVAKRVDSPDGLLAGSLAASIGAFAIGATTYDAFSFIQVTLLFFIIVALAASLLSIRRETPHSVPA